MKPRLHLRSLAFARSIAAITTVAVIAVTACNASEDTRTQDTDIQVGSSTVDVTPSKAVIIGGYASNRLSEGVHDPLFAKAVVIKRKGPGAKVAIVSIDAMGIGYADASAIRQAASEAVEGLLPAQIIVTATHTHSGPDTIGFWGASPDGTGINEGVMESIHNAAVRAIVEADARTQPAEFSVVSVDYAPTWVSNISEPASIDSELTAVAFKDSRGDIIATLTNFACHPTSIGESHLLSSDYLSAFYKAMNQSFSGDHLFLQGSIGGWVQPSEESRGFEFASSIGNDLAEKTASLLSQAPSSAVDTVAAVSTKFTVPLRNPVFKGAISAGAIKRTVEDGSLATEVTLFQIGPLKIITHPGETAPYMAEKTRDILGSDFEMIVNLGQDQMGYILRPEFFEHGSPFPHAPYLASMSPAPEAAGKVLEAVERTSNALTK